MSDAFNGPGQWDDSWEDGGNAPKNWPANAVEIGRTASGKITVTVKVRDDDADEAARRAQVIFDEIQARYGFDTPTIPPVPASVTTGGGEGPDSDF